MPRKGYPTKVLYVRVDESIHDNIIALALRTGLSISTIVELILSTFLEEIRTKDDAHTV